MLHPASDDMHARNSNVFGAAIAGAGAGILMAVVMCIVVSANPTPNDILSATGLALILVLRKPSACGEVFFLESSFHRTYQDLANVSL